MGPQHGTGAHLDVMAALAGCFEPHAQPLDAATWTAIDHVAGSHTPGAAETPAVTLRAAAMRIELDAAGFEARLALRTLLGALADCDEGGRLDDWLMERTVTRLLQQLVAGAVTPTAGLVERLGLSDSTWPTFAALIADGHPHRRAVEAAHLLT